MSRVAVPPVNVEAWLMGPWAASVPVPLRLPDERLRLPVTVRVVPAAIDFVEANVTLLNVSGVDTVRVAAAPLKETVPAGALNVPPLTVNAPVTDMVPPVVV